MWGEQCRRNMTALKKTVRTRKGVEPAGRPARREVERGRGATNELVHGRVRSRAGRRGEIPGRAGQTRRGTSVRMSAMPQARPSLLGPRSTRKVQPVQSSRASFLWLFSSVAMVLCAALAP